MTTTRYDGLSATRGGSVAIGARRPALALLGVIALWSTLLAITPSAVWARQARLFTGSFGSATSITTDPYPLANPYSVAVDHSSGLSAEDVYVTDPEHHRVEKFDSTGHFLLMFGKEVNKTAVVESATRSSEESVCPAPGHPADVCQAGAAGTAPGAFESPNVLFVAVDSSPGPSAGDVYVGDNDGKVTKFDSEGRVVSGWASAGQLDGSAITAPPATVSGPFGEVDGVATDPSGNLWVYASAGGLNRGRAFEFRQDASLVTDWEAQMFPGAPQGIAVDSQDNVYFRSVFGLEKFESGGEFLGQLNREELFAVGGFGVDPSTDDVYAFTNPRSYPGPGSISRYASGCHPACTPVESFGSGRGAIKGGIALDPATPTDTLYGAEPTEGRVVTFGLGTVPDVVTEKASGFTATAITLNGTVNPDGVELEAGLEGCRFEWGEVGSAYEHEAACDKTAPQIGKGASPVEVHASISGLQAGKSYHFRLTAANPNDLDAALVIDEPEHGADLRFGPPLADFTSVTEVSATGAGFQAQIDPQNIDTHFHFELLSQAEYEANGDSFSGPDAPFVFPSADADIGAGEGDVSFTDQIQGLSPRTVYRYRVLAANALSELSLPGGYPGPTRSFTTQGAGETLLPDGRQYEMVSPPQKHGALIEPLNRNNFCSCSLIQAAAAGDAITYIADAPTEAQTAGNSNDVQVFSARGLEGWQTHDLTVSHIGATSASVGKGNEYRFFSDDLLFGVVQPFGAFVPESSPLALAPREASEQTAFLHTDYLSGNPDEPCSDSCYRPLVTGKEPFANVREGARFGEYLEQGKIEPCPPRTLCGPEFVGASPDARRVVFTSYTQLTGQAAPQGGLYEWDATKPPSEQLQLVSVLPSSEGGGVVPGAGLGDSAGARVNARGAISTDGSRVFWAPLVGGHLYVHDVPQDRTVELDVPEPCGSCGSGSPTAEFQFASSDGSHVFFTDSQPLTAAAGTVGGRALYECSIEESAGEPVCRLTDLTPPNGTEPPNVQGTVIGASEDGSYVYFVANGDLSAGAVQGDCGKVAGKLEGTCNLYVRHQGTTRLVAALSVEDATDWADGYGPEPEHDLEAMRARVSPNGEWLAFMSDRSLTGYDNRDALSGRPDEETYLYNAGTQRLVCASCNPSGARPAGAEFAEVGPLVGGSEGWEQSSWLAATVPGWTPYRLLEALYQSRYLSNTGRLFFDAHDALVPSDVNKTWDVYEYEPEGIGDCTSSTLSGSEVFKPASTVEVEGRSVEEGAGCVGLISSGESPQESAFFDASATGGRDSEGQEGGGDVFFLTTSKLAPQDFDDNYDIYDAHECTSVSPCLSPPASPPHPCDTEASCRPSPTPQPAIYGAPTSATFSGIGNAPPTQVTPLQTKRSVAKHVKRKRCAARHTLEHGKCVASKSKRRARRAASKRGR